MHLSKTGDEKMPPRQLFVSISLAISFFASGVLGHESDLICDPVSEELRSADLVAYARASSISDVNVFAPDEIIPRPGKIISFITAYEISKLFVSNNNVQSHSKFVEALIYYPCLDCDEEVQRIRKYVVGSSQVLLLKSVERSNRESKGGDILLQLLHKYPTVNYIVYDVCGQMPLNRNGINVQVENYFKKGGALDD